MYVVTSKSVTFTIAASFILLVSAHCVLARADSRWSPDDRVRMLVQSDNPDYVVSEQVKISVFVE